MPHFSALLTFVWVEQGAHPAPDPRWGCLGPSAKEGQGAQTEGAREGARCRAGGGGRVRRARRQARASSASPACGRVALSGLPTEVRKVRSAGASPTMACSGLRGDAGRGGGVDAPGSVHGARSPHGARAMGPDGESLPARLRRHRRVVDRSHGPDDGHAAPPNRVEDRGADTRTRQQRGSGGTTTARRATPDRHR